MKKHVDAVPGIFLDRDGTINVDFGYGITPEKVRLFSGSGKAIRMLNRAGMPVVVISNQSGVARKIFTRQDVERTNGRLKMLLKRHGAHLDAVYYCPHLPDAGCDCRKPNTALIKKGIRVFGINPEKSFVIGDKLTDIELGKKTGMETVLVLTGTGRSERKRITRNTRPDRIVGNLYSAVKHVLKKTGRSGRC